MKKTRNIAFALAGLLAIGLAGATHADSATLKELVDGATLETNGITFFDFSYSPSTGALQASDINVQTVDHGLKFSAPWSANIDNQIIEFDINFYAAAGPGRVFNQATLSSVIGTSGNGEIGIGEVISTDSFGFLADLDNSADEGTFINFDSATFLPTGNIYVTSGFGLSGGAVGSANLSDFTQTFKTIPTPAAAVAGLSLMGVLALRRRGPHARR